MKRYAIAAMALSLFAAGAQAQKPRRPVPQTEGLMLGGTTVLAAGITISGPEVREDIKTSMGQGVGIQVGYGFTPRLMGFASGTVVKQNSSYGPFDGSFGLALLEVGARMTFPQPGKRMIPYVSAHAGTHGLGASSNEGGINATLRLSGTQIGLGGGILYALTPSMSLDAGAVADRGKFGKLKLSGDINREGPVNVNASTTLRLRVGFNWHP
jgi:hypothetical protein